jgi:hypothetical protein
MVTKLLLGLTITGIALSAFIDLPKAQAPGHANRPVEGMAPPADFDVRRAEFDAALRKNTELALVRFIARHPDHALAGEAVALLMQGGRASGDAGTDPDAAIFMAFAEAARSGDRQALEHFATANPDHPLATIARNYTEATP